jgi:hypothetical protein
MMIDLKPEDTRIIDQAVQAGLIHHADDAVEVGVETLRSRLQARLSSGSSSRQEAVWRMREFGDNYPLGLGKRITRHLLHEGHRY